MGVGFRGEKHDVCKCWGWWFALAGGRTVMSVKVFKCMSYATTTKPFWRKCLSMKSLLSTVLLAIRGCHDSASWYCLVTWLLLHSLTKKSFRYMCRVPSTPVRQHVKFPWIVPKRCSPGCGSGHVQGILQLLSDLFHEYFCRPALWCEHQQGPYLLLLLMAFAGSSSSVNLRWFLAISLLPTGLRGAAGNWQEACSLHSAAAWQSH